MSETTHHKATLWRRLFGPRDWRIWLGIVITALWIVGGVIYVAGTARGAPPSMADVGSFLEGAFAPLAFLWLVLGLFVQQQELANNTEVLRRTSVQSEKQTHAIAATEMNARRETFFQIATAVRRQLGSISGMLWMSSQSEIVPAETYNEYWNQYATGDYEVFARLFLSMIGEEDMEQIFYGTEIRRRHTRNYCHAFERLRALAADCDIDGIIEDSLVFAGHGLLYTRMQNYRPAQLPEDEVTPP